jgi:hypothetical protein
VCTFSEFDDDPASNDQVNANSDDKTPEVVLRRTQSFEADDKLVHEHSYSSKIDAISLKPLVVLILKLINIFWWAEN